MLATLGFWVGLCIGLVIGASTGIVCFALFSINKELKEDRELDRY